MPLDVPAQARPLRALFVDDDPLMLAVIQRVLRNNPHIEPTFASNAIDALLAIGTTRPDLVVMDVYMPGLDGVEACRRIKTNPDTRSIPVILTSASMTRDLEAAALAAGADRATEKPHDVAGLLELTRPTTPPVPEVEPEQPKMRCADLLVQMLVDAGVDVVFGLPGGAIAPVHDALIDSRARVITTRHEAGAMFAAAGYAHTTGKLGVVAVTSGPGALNCMTGLASAWCDGLPVLLLVGEVARPAQGKGVLQDSSAHGLQVVEMARHVTKLAAEVPRPSALPHLLRRAITTALSGRKGPVMLTLPFDVMTSQAVMPRAGGAIRFGGMVEPEIVGEVAELLCEAKQPIVIAGSGVRGGGAPERLRKVAERLGCPVATTPKAKGVFPENHALSLGVIGLGGHASARAYLDHVDVVVAIGTSLNEMATDGFSSRIQARALVHVDIDARQIGKSYAPTHAIVASAADFLGGLSDRLDEREPSGFRPFPPPIERHRLPSSTKPGRVAAQDALAEIQALLPHDTIYTVDSGEHFVFATHYLEITRPDAFVVMTGLGSMGSSIGAAIGAQLAHPDRSVAAICGDGCFAMNAFEIATAVASGLPIRVFVFNDERLGMVEKGNALVYGRTPEYGTAPMDVCSVARGLGASVLSVHTTGQLHRAADALRTIHGPVVIEVRLDHEISLPKNGRVAELAKVSATSAPPPRPSSPAVLRIVN
jgi:acetolactate synthase-1/2/3 large subunit